MATMARERKGGLNVDPAVLSWQKAAATNKAALSKKQRADRKRVRVKYDLPPDLKDEITAIAEAQESSASQVAGWLLRWAVGQWRAEDEGPMHQALFEAKRPSRSLRFRWDIDF